MEVETLTMSNRHAEQDPVVAYDTWDQMSAHMRIVSIDSLRGSRTANMEIIDWGLLRVHGTLL